MIRGQMGIAQRHLKRFGDRQLTDGTKIHACHNKPTGKGVTIAMPSVVREFGILENPNEPVHLLQSPAARTFVPIFLMKAKLVAAGKSKAEIVEATASALDKKELPELEPGAMCYMTSKQLVQADGAIE